MSQEKHIYNFSSDGSGVYYKLWLWLFDSGIFARLHASSWRVYCRLVSLADFTTGQLQISQKQLAADCGLTRQRMPEILADLDRAGLVVVRNQQTSRGNDICRYYLTSPLQNASEQACYCGQVVSDRPVDVNVSAPLPGHVRLSGELFRSQYFTDLGRDHTRWKTYCSLLFRADFQTGYCWPSLAQIQLDAGLARATVVQAIQRLQEDSLIKIEKYTTSDGNFANAYYIWPYASEFKKRTGGSSKNGPGVVQKTDTGSSESKHTEFKKRTAGDVRFLNPNNITTNINTNLSESEGFSERIIDIYLSGNKRRGIISREQIKAAIDLWSQENGLSLVAEVIRNNPEIYSLSAMGNLVSNAGELARKKALARTRHEMAERAVTPVLETQSAVRVRSQKEIIESYQKILEQGDNPFIRSRLEKLLSEKQESAK